MPLANEIYYYSHTGAPGDKPPVVLIHGAGGAHLYWPAELRHLPGNQIFALDLPGHGKSGGPGRQSIAAYANAVLSWMDTIQLGAAVLVGHSMGSAIALTLALDHPDRLLGLGLVGGGARLRVHPDIVQNTLSQTTCHLAIETIIGWAFSPQASPRLIELAAARMAETRPSVLHGDFLACDSFDVTGRLTEVRQPTLVLCGADDRLTPVSYAKFLAARIPSAQLQIIPAAGHMVMLEQPQAVAEKLSAFLAALPR